MDTLAGVGLTAFIGGVLACMGMMLLTRYRRTTAVIAAAFVGIAGLGMAAMIVSSTL